PRVAFVGSEQEFVDRYTPLLAGTLRDLGVEVEGVLLSDLRRRGVEALGALEPPEHVATLVRSYAEVRKLLRDTAVPVFGRALEQLGHDLIPIPTARLRDELVASRLAVTDPPAGMASPA